MPKVDIKQDIKLDSHRKTDIQVNYARETVMNGERFHCTIRLTNGFEGRGSVERNYSDRLSDEQATALAHERALNYVRMHGYDLT